MDAYDDDDDIAGLYAMLPDADAACVSDAFASASKSCSLPHVNVSADLLGQRVSEMDDGVVANLLAGGGVRMSSNGSIVVRTSTAFCKVCHVKAIPLGGAGGTKVTGYRYAFHCPSCHNSWSQMRPDDIPDGGDPMIKDGCKKRPKPGRCSCVAVAPSHDVHSLVKDALSLADAVNFIAGCVAPPDPFVVYPHIPTPMEAAALASSPIAVAVEIPVPSVPASAVQSKWVQSKRRVRTLVDGVPQTYTGAAAYAVLQKSLDDE